MIAVDTSALMAIPLDEPQAPDCVKALASSHPILISAATVAELLIVAEGRGVRSQMDALINGLGLRVVPLDPAAARRVSDVHARWGRGFHAAALNFGDCFAYELANSSRCPLLYVGDDFARTDITSVL